MSTRPLVTAVLAVAGSTMFVSPASADRHREIFHAPVVDVVPIVETSRQRIPYQDCRDEVVRMAPRGRGRFASPGVIGAVVGGTVGSIVGDNTGRQGWITGAGALLGASVGREIARNQRGDHVRYTTEEVCSVSYELREIEEVAAYRVSYRIGDTIYQTRTTTEPGDTLPVRIEVQPLR